MQSVGQASTQSSSLVQVSVMTYAMVAISLSYSAARFQPARSGSAFPVRQQCGGSSYAAASCAGGITHTRMYKDHNPSSGDDYHYAAVSRRTERQVPKRGSWHPACILSSKQLTKSANPWRFDAVQRRTG